MQFLLDSSVIRNGLLRLTEAAAIGGHKLLIPALVHAEQLFQDRRRRADNGKPFDPRYFEEFRAKHKDTLQILDMSSTHAEETALRLFSRYPGGEAWRAAKRAVARHCCACPESAEDAHPSRDCGAPVDLYLAALASPETPIITAERQGFEWKEWEAGAVVDVAQALDLMGAT